MQHISVARVGAHTSCDTEVLTNGCNLSQVKATERVGNQVIVASVGTTAPRLESHYHAIPQSLGPDEAPKRHWDSEQSLMSG